MLLPNKFNIGYFEGRQHTKKWLVSSQDREVMYAGKEFIFVWCDGNEQEVGGESIPKKRVKRDTLSSKRAEKEEELEDIFQTLETKHGSNFSTPQLRLWAQMIVTGSHSDIDIPPTINGIQKQTTHTESLTDVVSSAAAAIAKVLTPPSTPTPTLNSPNETVDTRMKNLEQFKYLQQLLQVFELLKILHSGINSF